MKKKLSPVVFALAMIGLAAASVSAAKNVLVPPTEQEIKSIEQALPVKAPAKPAKARKILIFSRCDGFVHKSIPAGVKSMEMLGEKTGAYTSEHSTDLEAFTPGNLARFDAVLFLSSTKLDPAPEQKKALLDFARSGNGIIGIHAASDSFYEWEDGAAMIGGLFCGHPWTSGCTVQVKLDEPDHPINACFEGQSFKIKDEIYQFKDPYSRAKQRVLTSLDMDDPDTKAVKGGNPAKIVRTDTDFGITWIKHEGKGRVFYCSLGHNSEVFWNPKVLEHYLSGIQYALGDYAVPDKIK